MVSPERVVAERESEMGMRGVVWCFVAPLVCVFLCYRERERERKREKAIQ
jgi:hypothetical protein